MIDEERSTIGQSDGAEMLLYDWFKYLTSLSLLTLGGVLGLVQGNVGADVKEAMLILVLALLSIAGVASFTGAAMVVESRTKPKPVSPYINATGAVAATSLSMGVGAFLFIFVKVIQ